MNETATLVIAILSAALTGALAALVTGLFQRGKMSAESRAVAVNADISLSAEARELYDDAKAAAHELREEMAALREQVQRLETLRGQDRTLIRLLIEWSRRMRDEVIARGGTPPDAPVGLDLDHPHSDFM